MLGIVKAFSLTGIPFPVRDPSFPIPRLYDVTGLTSNPIEDKQDEWLVVTVTHAQTRLEFRKPLASNYWNCPMNSILQNFSVFSQLMESIDRVLMVISKPDPALPASNEKVSREPKDEARQTTKDEARQTNSHTLLPENLNAKVQTKIPQLYGWRHASHSSMGLVTGRGPTSPLRFSLGWRRSTSSGTATHYYGRVLFDLT